MHKAIINQHMKYLCCKHSFQGLQKPQIWPSDDNIFCLWNFNDLSQNSPMRLVPGFVGAGHICCLNIAIWKNRNVFWYLLFVFSFQNDACLGTSLVRNGLKNRVFCATQFAWLYRPEYENVIHVSGLPALYTETHV